MIATENFGAYLLQPIGDDLLVGCGNSPGNEDGCQIFRSADGAAFAHEFEPSEQGSVVDGQLLDGEWWVCGIDAIDDWSLGNIYRRSAAGVWSKIRTLPNVIHAFGLWHDGATICVAVGAHMGDNATWRGRVLRSSDGGATWTSVDVNGYRLYDILGFDGKLYATGYDWTGSAYTQDVHVSSDAGATWTKVAGVTPSIKPRLVLHAGSLIGARSSGLFAIASGGAVTLYATPFTLAAHWNVLDSDGTYLYALDSGGWVWRSSDFNTWTAYAQVSGAISIKWWPGHGLMIGDMGTAARIWLA